MDETPSVLYEILERPCFNILWPPGLEPIAMVEEQLEQRIRILRIIFGAAG